ncbi:MAG: hypothetical protein KDD53_11880, partial [Bdellovibrionales bacterium]|nr:hypothetical protein [Bdellovibrionales bacterium]
GIMKIQGGERQGSASRLGIVTWAAGLSLAACSFLPRSRLPENTHEVPQEMSIFEGEGESHSIDQGGGEELADFGVEQVSLDIGSERLPSILPRADSLLTSIQDLLFVRLDHVGALCIRAKVPQNLKIEAELEEGKPFEVLLSLGTNEDRAEYSGIGVSSRTHLGDSKGGSFEKLSVDLSHALLTARVVMIQRVEPHISQDIFFECEIMPAPSLSLVPGVEGLRTGVAVPISFSFGLPAVSAQFSEKDAQALKETFPNLFEGRPEDLKDFDRFFEQAKSVSVELGWNIEVDKSNGPLSRQELVAKIVSEVHHNSFTQRVFSSLRWPSAAEEEVSIEATLLCIEAERMFFQVCDREKCEDLGVAVWSSIFCESSVDGIYSVALSEARRSRFLESAEILAVTDGQLANR